VSVYACEPFIENPVVKKQHQLEYRSFLRGFSLKEKNEPSDQPANDRKKTHGVILLPRLIRYWSVIFYRLCSFFFTPQLMVHRTFYENVHIQTYIHIHIHIYTQNLYILCLGYIVKRWEKKTLFLSHLDLLLCPRGSNSQVFIQNLIDVGTWLIRSPSTLN